MSDFRLASGGGLSALGCGPRRWAMGEDASRVAVHGGPMHGMETEFLQLNDLTGFSPALPGPPLVERITALEGSQGQ